MANREIKELIRKRRLRQYEVAKAIGVCEFTFSRWLREEMSENKKREILNVINEMKI